MVWILDQLLATKPDVRNAVAVSADDADRDDADLRAAMIPRPSAAPHPHRPGDPLCPPTP